MSRESKDLRGILLEVLGVQLLMVFIAAPVSFLILKHLFG